MSTLRRRRKGAVVAAGLAGAVTVSAAAVAALGFGGSSPPSTDRTADAPAATVAVSRRTLVDETTVAGQLGYGAAEAVQSRTEGTLTWLPAVGATIRRGGVLFRADNKPVVLLYGALPMYRTLTKRIPASALGQGTSGGGTGTPGGSTGTGAAGTAGTAGGTGTGTTGTGTTGTSGTGATGTSGTGTSGTGVASAGTPATVGPDVEQFERNLRALGYGGFTVDQRFTAATAAAVKRWQKDLGLPQTGTVGIDQVVYSAGPIRIATHSVRVGASAAGNLLTSTSTTKVVTVDVRVSDMAWAVKGAHVTVALPRGGTVPGTVTAVGADASSESSGGAGGQSGSSGSGASGATVTVTVSVARQEAFGRLETAPVDVRYVAQTRKDILAVPVAALLALAEGGYGLELADGAGNHVVAVRTGLFADGWVEVSGTGIRAGQKVGMPG